MASIVLTESSAGRNILGDNYFTNGKEKPFLLKSFGVGQVKLETAIKMILKYPNILKKYIIFIHKNPFIFKKYIKFLINIQYFQYLHSIYIHKHTKRAKKVLRWINRVLKINKEKMKPYMKYYRKDLELAQLLLSDLKFNVTIGTLYLITNYDYALKHHLWNPYFKTISRYNGGWRNKIYYKRVMKNMRIWRRIKHDIENER